MPIKKKPTAKQLAARKKFVEMVRAKAKAKKAAAKHTDTKSHNVNVKVVSGTKKKSATRQTGTSVKSKDKQRTALPPGKRTTGKGKAKHTYTERRANRSDKPGSLLGVQDLKNDTNKFYINQLHQLNTQMIDTELYIDNLKNRIPTYKTKEGKSFFKAALQEQKAKLILIKHQIRLIKRQIK